MDYTINERITQIRKELNLSQTVFGEKLGVSRGVIKNIDEKNTIPKSEFLSLICKVFNVDPFWLESGEGDMFLPQSEEDELMQFASEMIHDKDLNWLKQLVLSVMQSTPEERSAASRFYTALAESICNTSEKDKEQDS